MAGRLPVCEVPLVNSPYTRKQWLVLVGCFALLAALGWLDYRTGYELGFFVFYSVPVGLAAWHLGLGPGVLMSIASAVTWWIADTYDGEKYSSPFYLYWNTAIHTACFVINAVTIAKIKQTLDRQRLLLDQLEDSQAEVRRLDALLRTHSDTRRSFKPPRTLAEANDKPEVARR